MVSCLGVEGVLDLPIGYETGVVKIVDPRTGEVLTRATSDEGLEGVEAVIQRVLAKRGT